MSKQQVDGLARRRNCPRCNLEKTLGNALCRLCRMKLPPHMRQPLEKIAMKDSWVVARAIRVAASYFDVHYRSIRYFGGGRMR
jgi:predicted amidophosphoribosyltransferase